jgi:hypothetical protein
MIISGKHINIIRSMFTRSSMVVCGTVLVLLSSSLSADLIIGWGDSAFDSSDFPLSDVSALSAGGN